MIGNQKRKKQAKQIDPRIFQTLKLVHKDLKINTTTMCTEIEKTRLKDKFTKEFMEKNQIELNILPKIKN